MTATLKWIIYLTKLRSCLNHRRDDIFKQVPLLSLSSYLCLSLLDTGRKLNVHKTFNLCPVSMGSVSLSICFSVSLCLLLPSLPLPVSLSLFVLYDIMIWYIYLFSVHTGRYIHFSYIYYNNSCDLNVTANKHFNEK